MPQPKNKNLKVVFIVLGILVLVVAGIFVYKAYTSYASRLAMEEATPVPTTVPTPTPTPMPTAPPTPQPTPIPTQEPTPTPARYDFDALRAEYSNEDVVGYLKIEGTSIDYPVLQSKDNLYYLKHNIRKENDSAGWVYMDYENNIENNDKNTIIYAHNMKKDIMFHSLRYYVERDYFEKHKYIVFDTPNGQNVWEIFSFYKTTTDFNYIKVLFKDDEDFYDLASQMKKRSRYDTGVEITAEDRVLTLSTCTGIKNEDTRYVVSAKLIQNPEDWPDYLKIWSEEIKE